MDVHPLRDEKDHAWALREIAPYFEREPEPGSPDADRFEVLSVLIEAYEAKRHDLPEADPVAILRFAIADLGRSRDDLSRILGSQALASEVLDRRRPLTLDMIRAIATAWHLPLDVLAQPYALARDSA